MTKLNPSIELQKAIYSKLKSGPYPVYDGLPMNGEFPHIVIGDEFVTRNDVKGGQITEHIFYVSTWSAYNGTKELKEIYGFVISSLIDEPLEVTGFDCFEQEVYNSHTYRELDGNTNTHVSRSIIQLRFSLYRR